MHIRSPGRPRPGVRLWWLLVLAATVGFVPAAPTATASAPSNDDYADAAVIESLPYTDTRDISGATSEPLEKLGSCTYPRQPHAVVPNVFHPSVWYRFAPTVDVQVTIDTTASDFTKWLIVWEGQDLLTQQEVTCNGFSGPRIVRSGPLTLDLEGGRSYAIQLLDGGGRDSVLEFRMEETDLPGVAQILPFEVEAGDGTSLRGHVYLPEGEGPFAPVLEYSPYWNTAYGPSESFTDDNNGHVTMVRWLRPLMDAGFAVALVNMRGTGESGGCLQWGGPIDSSDVATVIEALADAEWSTGRVGMYGYSFPGWSQMLALASDDAPSLEAVVPVSPVTDLWTLYTRNGATQESRQTRQPLFTALLATGGLAPVGNHTGVPFVPDTGPAHVACPRYSQELGTSPPVWNGDRTAYWQERNLRPLIDGTKVAVFATVGLRSFQGEGSGGWDGHISQLDGVWDLLGPHRRFMLGQWGHGLPPGPDFDGMAVAWLDRYLRGGSASGVAPPGMVEYEDDSGLWHTARQWPPHADDATLWLSDDDLVTEPGDVEPSSRTFLSSDQVPCAGICLRPFAGRLPGCRGDHLVYVSEPLAEEVVVAGHFTVDLTIESTLADGTLASFLYHTDADDPCAAADHVESGQAIADLRHVFVDEGADFPVDTPTHITLTSVPLASRIPAGHRLVLTVGSAGWNTVPDPYRPVLTVTTGPGSVSALTLPVVSGDLATAH